MSEKKTSRAQDVRAFHEACGLPCGNPAAPGLTHEEARLRAKLIAEEAVEVMHALGLTQEEVAWAFAGASVAQGGKDGGWPAHPGQAANMERVAKECADLAYVTEGTLVQAGLPAEEIWAVVHASNMAKAGGPRRSDGKLLKPDGWAPPDVAGVLERAKGNASAPVPSPRMRHQDAYDALSSHLREAHGLAVTSLMGSRSALEEMHDRRYQCDWRNPHEP